VKFARADIFLEYSASKEAKSLSADHDIRSFHGIRGELRRSKQLVSLTDHRTYESSGERTRSKTRVSSLS
jgi:hypothetical protein